MLSFGPHEYALIPRLKKNKQAKEEAWVEYPNVYFWESMISL